MRTWRSRRRSILGPSTAAKSGRMRMNDLSWSRSLKESQLRRRVGRRPTCRRRAKARHSVRRLHKMKINPSPSSGSSPRRGALPRARPHVPHNPLAARHVGPHAPPARPPAHPPEKGDSGSVTPPPRRRRCAQLLLLPSTPMPCMQVLTTEPRLSPHSSFALSTRPPAPATRTAVTQPMRPVCRRPRGYSAI
jgi:hypothetical protein